MKFCAKCNNFLFDIVEVEEQGKREAHLKCRSCPYTESITKQNPIVYEHELHEDTEIQFSINEHYKNDPTLPTFRNILCPNEDCGTRTSGAKPSVKGVKLDAVNVMWLYQCTVCNETWKQLARG
jgi:DNA-directed RNA polymerase subunit M/transcription elongation factor TFIIS